MVYKSMLWVFIIIVAIAEALGQSSLALGRKSGNSIWLLGGMLCYAVVAYGLYMSYKYKGVGIVNALWSSISIVLMLAIGYFYFNERLAAMEWVGVICIIVGVLLTQIAHHAHAR